MSNKLITVNELGNGLRAAKTNTETDLSQHNSSEAAHPFILGEITNLEDRLFALEIANGVEVTANPFAVTFGSLDGTVSDGIWDSVNMRLGF